MVYAVRASKRANTSNTSAFSSGTLTGNFAVLKVNNQNVVTQSQLASEGFLRSIPAGYVTETQLASKGYVTNTELEAKGYVNGNSEDYVSYLNEAGYLKSIPLQYVTETSLASKG